MKMLTNISSNTIVLTDLNGLSVAPNETIDGCIFGEDFLRKSKSVTEEILHMRMSVSDADSTITYTGVQGIQFIQGLAQRTTLVGTPIVTSSDRPEGAKRFYTSSGDNTVNNTRYNGNELLFDVAPNSEQTIDVQFIENVWVKDGAAFASNAAFGSHISIAVVVPAGMPVPALGHGNFDFDGTNWIPNTNNTGQYLITNVETVLDKFINKYPILNGNSCVITSPECDLLPPLYILRATVFNADTNANLKCAIVLGMYRPSTTAI